MIYTSIGTYHNYLCVLVFDTPDYSCSFARTFETHIIVHLCIYKRTYYMSCVTTDTS